MAAQLSMLLSTPGCMLRSTNLRAACSMCSPSTTTCLVQPVAQNPSCGHTHHVHLPSVGEAVKPALQLLCQRAAVAQLHGDPHLEAGMAEGRREGRRQPAAAGGRQLYYLCGAA